VQTHPAGSYPSASQPTHVWDYWAVVMKRIILVIFFCLLSVGVAYFVTNNQTRQYRATATVQILPPSVIGPQDALFTPAITNDEQYLQTQLAILATNETILRAVTEGRLRESQVFAGKSAEDIARLAYGRVECSRQRGLYLVNVSVVGADPEVLAPICNALVTTFQNMQKSDAKQRLDVKKGSLEEIRTAADSNIRMLTLDKTAALKGANFSESTFESEYEKISASRERFAKLNDELLSELLNMEPTVAALRQAQAAPAGAIEAIAQLPFIRTNERVGRVDEQIVQLNDRREALLRGGLLPNNEDVKNVDAQIEQAKRDRAHVIESEVQKYLLDYQNKKSTSEKYVQQIEKRTDELTAAAALKQTLSEKTAEIERNKVNKEAAIRQLEIVEQHESEERDAVHPESTAQKPTEPYSPNKAANMIMGLVFGIVGGIALAFLLDYLDDTIRTKDELAKIAPDVPLLGIVPNIEARKSDVAKKDLFAANQPKSTISEAYRGVRTALTLSARGPQQKAMLLTSAGPREGKTTTAINLATVLAFSGARTLVIDADLRKPRVHASFNLPNKKGLTNLIVGEDDPSEFCQSTQVERVDVLTSGPIPPNPSELLGRPRMREILRRLRDRYDQIIVDTPPIGAVTDAAVIATMVDGVILVVHAGKTRRQIVSRGIEQLRYINAPIIGVILNNLHLGRGRYYPGYYHYYYYYASHYGAEDGEPKKAKPAKTAAAAAPPDDAGPGPVTG
jgi:capsular exopolysaccharide synthesis family protein